MKIEISRLTAPQLVLELALFTQRKKPSHYILPDELESFITSEHSPIYTLLYKITMLDIPERASVHLVRHSVGVQHYVSTSRPDWAPDAPKNLKNHIIIGNPVSLSAIAHKRLCTRAWQETYTVVAAVKEALEQGDGYDKAVARHMVPVCEYRRGCPEGKFSCGKERRL